VALLVAASVSSAGTIVRGTKATGGTAFVSGKIFPAEVNYDFDTIYTEINGEIDNANIASDAAIVATKIVLTDVITNTHVNSAAAIAYTKMSQAVASGDDGDDPDTGIDADIVDDYSIDEDEQATASDPGTSDATTLATNMQEELEQLRYKIEQLTVGLSAAHVANGAAEDTDASWIDGPARSFNHIKNGGFDVWTTANCAPCSAGFPADFWGLVGTPNLADTPKTAADGEGVGFGLLVTGNGGSGEGVSQTIDGIKADTKYLARAIVKPTSGDSCTLSTTGALTTQMSDVSTGTGAYEVISGIFVTDSTPSAVAIQLLATADGDICLFDDVALFEISDDPLPRPQKVHCHDRITTQTADHYLNTGFTSAGVTCSVTPPGPGYMITIRAAAHADNSVNTADNFELQLIEDCGSAAVVDHAILQADVMNAANADDSVSIRVFYINDAPVVGTTCTYTITGRGESNNWDRNDPADNINSTAGGFTWIDVIMEPTG
jgi:hypothetical protein